jgi:PAS domain-containing protein
MPESIWGPYVFSAYAVPVALTAILMVAFGVSLVVRQRSRVSMALCAMTVFGGVWLTAFTFMYLAPSAPVALTWAKLAYLGVPFLAPAIYNFTVEMLRIADRRRRAVLGAWVGAGVFSALALFTGALVNGVHHYSWGYYPRYGVPASLPFLLFFFGYLVASLVEFIRALPAAQGVERQRIRLLITGFAVAYFGCVDYLPKYGIDVYPFGYVPILAFVVIVTHTVRMYDLLAITPQFAAREIIGTMADPLFVCDAERRIRVVNEAAESLTGYPRGALIGKSIDDVIESRALTAYSSPSANGFVASRDSMTSSVPAP